MKKYIEIKADYNDGDYVTSRTQVTEEEIEELMPIIETIKANSNRNNWDDPYGMYEDELTEKQIDLFKYYTPSSPDAQELHTIVSIKVIEVASEISLLI